MRARVQVQVQVQVEVEVEVAGPVIWSHWLRIRVRDRDRDRDRVRVRVRVGVRGQHLAARVPVARGDGRRVEGRGEQVLEAVRQGHALLHALRTALALPAA